ncbi:DUF2567 domain-containing protein [Streptomyces sp. NPDC088725]|uniref:DUF2567 domain-containing protein n=1 Tax=Streptomyces sp. NPDC088725 TaxID=3365873 RepID=UPI0037F34E0E
MTAPLTPPHQPPSDQNPWQTPPGGSSPYSGSGSGPYSGSRPGADTGPGRNTELRQALVVLLAVTVSGVVLGLLWLWLAPRIPLVSDSSAVFLKDTEGEEAIGADGTFVLLALAFGLVSAAAVFLFRRRGGVPLVLGLAIGGLLGSVLAWKLGGWLGPTSDVVAHAKAVGKGVTFDAPLQLNMKGALLAWPVAAMVVHLALTGLFGPRDPEPGHGDQAAPYAGQQPWGAPEK